MRRYLIGLMLAPAARRALQVQRAHATRDQVRLVCSYIAGQLLHRQHRHREAHGLLPTLTPPELIGHRVGRVEYVRM